MTFDNLLFERDGACVVITLNRPAVLNALSIALLTDLDLALTAIEHDADVGAVIITGAGDKAFAAGADIRELASLSGVAARAHATFGQQVFDHLQRLQRPVVAALNGLALGGGCELALACTLRIAAETVRIGQPEINLGLIPGFGGTQRLPRLIGPSRALDLILTGRAVSAREALEMGLVNRVVAPTELRQVTHALATELAAKPRHAVRSALEAVSQGLSLPLPHAQQLESALFGLVSDTPDAREGTAAFLAKRAPRFADR